MGPSNGESRIIQVWSSLGVMVRLMSSKSVADTQRSPPKFLGGVWWGL